MQRRSFLASIPAVLTAPVAARAEGEASQTISADRPFVFELGDQPGMFVVCYPCDRITHANICLLADGRMITAERFGGLHLNYGDGWKPLPPGAQEPQVVGWVVAVHRRIGAGWHRLASW